MKLKFSQNTGSDHLTMAYAVDEWRKQEELVPDDVDQFCYDNFMNPTFLKQIVEMKQQFAEMLCASKFLSNQDSQSPEHNIFSDNTDIICSIICAGLYPNIAFKRMKIKQNQVAHPTIRTVHGSAKLIDGSVNASSTKDSSGYVVYHTRQKLLGGKKLLPQTTSH